MSESSVLFLRVFVASPRDVAEERQIAYATLQALQYEPAYRGQVAVHIVAWDGPYAAVPLYTTVDPQTAIQGGLPRPSECDIVVVMLWGRMGTPLTEDYRKVDGSLFRSGTEWEYENAIRAHEELGRPEVLVYRRTEAPDQSLSRSRKELLDAKAQYEAVQNFFKSVRASNRGYIDYESTSDFAKRFRDDMRATVHRLVQSPPDPFGATDFVTVDLSPLAGKHVRVLRRPFSDTDTAAHFLEGIWLTAANRWVRARTFGKAWALRDRNTGRTIQDAGWAWSSEHEGARDRRPLREIGIEPGDGARSVFLSRSNGR